jgi:hypothetical protein
MSARIDEIAPAYVGEDRIVLTLDDPNIEILAFQPVQINIDYAGTEPEGTVLPMELVLAGPLTGQHKRRLFTRARPSSVIVVPEWQGGEHFVLLRELGHNLWQGRLLFDVEGEDLQRSEERTA